MNYNNEWDLSFNEKIIIMMVKKNLIKIKDEIKFIFYSIKIRWW